MSKSRRLGVGAAALVAAGTVLMAPARPALAISVCDQVNPPLDAPVACAVPGSADIGVPAGASHVRLEVRGAGGGGGSGAVAAGAGGNGTVVTGTATLPPHTTKLSVFVGGGGSGFDPNSGGAAAGEATVVYAYDNATPIGTLVIAAGGGGGGGTDVGGTTGTGKGGDGDHAGQGFDNGQGVVVIGGAPGTNVGPGIGGSGQYSGGTGAAASLGDPVPGGVGARINQFSYGGDGGWGFRGGGGGGAAETAPGVFMGAGGGGGFTYVDTTAMPTSTSAPATSGKGVGGAGAVGANGGYGAHGYLGLVFGEAPTVASIAPAAGRLAGGDQVTLTGTGLAGTQSVKIDGADCTSLVPGPTTVTCTTPGPALAGPKTVELTTPLGTVTKTNFFSYRPPPVIGSVAPTSGTGTGTLTINGTWLTDTSSVTVGGTACPVGSTSPTVVTCALPQTSGVGARDVVVTTPGGQDTAAGAYTYLAAPSISSVSPPSGPLAGPNQLTIQGSDLDDPTSVTVGGQSCLVVVESAALILCSVPPGVNAGATDVVVTTAGGTDTVTGGFTYLAAPAVTTVAPAAGALTGGGTLTITGTGLTGTTTVTVGGQACGSLAVTSPTEVTCVAPAGTNAGAVDVVLTAPGGSVTKTGGYTYQPPPVIPTVPTPAPTTSPTPTTPVPTTPVPTTPVPTTPAPAPQLSLALDVRAGGSVGGAPAQVSGGGLRARSQFTLTIYSSPVRLASGYADDNGSFSARVKLPSRACVAGGLHELVLAGFAPDGTVVRDSTWVLLDGSCKARGVTDTRPPARSLTYGTVHFPYASAKLTAGAKSALRAKHTTLRTAVRVAVTGYTQTQDRSKAAIRANKALALRRAKAIRAYLRSLGVKAPITVVGAGPVSPVRGKPQSYNRRVVVVVRY